MLKPAIAQYFICREKWRRVLAIRVDLHIHVYFDNNARMSHLMKILIRKLKGVYNLKEVGYYWAREVEKSKKQHYHIMLFLDGNKVKHSSNVIRITKALWVENWAGQHHIPTIKKPFKLGFDKSTDDKIIERMSYFAKGRGKGYRNPQAKDYSTSRLNPVK